MEGLWRESIKVWNIEIFELKGFELEKFDCIVFFFKSNTDLNSNSIS